MFGKAAEVTNNALASTDNSINNTISNLDRLINKQNEVVSPPNIEGSHNRREMGVAWWASGNPSKSSNSEVKPISQVGNRTLKYRIDLKASRIDLAQTENDDKKVKEISESKVDVLTEKLDSLKALTDLAATDKERSLLEIAQNRLTVQIINIVDSINESNNELVGEFNKPAGLNLMNQYKYETNSGEGYSIGRYISTPIVNMYLQLKERGEEAGKRARRKLEEFNNGFLDGQVKMIL